MKYSVITLALASAMLSATASAGFFVQDTRVLGTEDGAMGKHQPYEAPAGAAFRAPDGTVQSNQERYRNAELVVDLAYTAVSQHGTGVQTVFDGFGDGLPLSAAMSMIMPNGWRFYRDKSLDEKAVPASVSFPGGKPWPEVLKQIGDRYALHFHVDWYDRTVLMTKGRPGLGMMASNVKVIREPVPAVTTVSVIAPVASSAVVSIPAPAGATSFAAGAPGAGQASKTFAPGAASGAVVAVPSAAGPGGVPKVVAAGAGAPARTPAAVPVVVKPVVTAPPAPVIPTVPTWAVSTKDRTIREALKSWAGVAGWTFAPEHWHVPVDIPLTAGASFKGDFKTAVRQLIATTELSETPLQPCFYTNKVVRVVPINEMCNPDAR